MEAIEDACIIIDCIGIDFIDCLSNSSLKFNTSDYVVDEVNEYVEAKHEDYLTVHHLLPEELPIIFGIYHKYSGLSPADCSVLYLARKTGGILLTNEKRLRAVAEQEGVTVHGELWLLDQLVTEGVITPQQAQEALSKLLTINKWLPTAKCEELIEKWKRSNPSYL